MWQQHSYLYEIHGRFVTTMIVFSFFASYVSTLKLTYRRVKLRWNPTRHMRLTPELNLQHTFTLNHVQFKLDVLLNAVNLESRIEWHSVHGEYCWGFMKNWIVECVNVSYCSVISDINACMFWLISRLTYDYLKYHCVMKRMAWHACMTYMWLVITTTSA